MRDLGMAAFSVFYMQSPSFLAHQKRLEQGHGRSNCTSLFGVPEIPSDNHIRDMLDPAQPALLHPAFDDALTALEAVPGGLDTFRRPDNRVLIALDGTEYFCSNKISCPHCSTRLRSNGKTEYFHAMLGATLVAGGHDKVIPLPPEFVAPQDGAEKQDCENAAAKRKAGGPRGALRQAQSGLSRRRPVFPPAAVRGGHRHRRAFHLHVQTNLASADRGIYPRR
jgi:hypothetical protein